MKTVGFFDWLLNSERPVSWIKVYHRLNNDQVPDIHSAVHLGIVLSGKYTGLCSGEQLALQKDECFITAPWEPHCSCRSADDRKILLLNLDYGILRSNFFGNGNRLDALWKMQPAKRMQFINSNHRIQKLIKMLITDCELPESPKKILYIWNSIVRFFIGILPETDIADQKNASGYHRIQPALEKLSSKLMSVNDAARYCNMSASHFSMLFKSLFGLSFARYERTFRLNGAANAIQRGYTLKEAATEWGFCDKSHLARLLRQRM